tara:strand:- start:2352 stop:2549 length:198 start_codon:yes stop_codon:yes gene_type:complete
MNPPPRDQNAHQKEIEEFLAKGGKIQKFEYGQRTEDLEVGYSFYGRRKKPAAKSTADKKTTKKKK